MIVVHVVIGLLLTVSAFFLSKWVASSLPYFGLLNPAAMTLLVLGPISVSMIGHPFKVWRSSLDVLVRAFRHDPQVNLFRASEDMMQMARAVRESRWQEAEDAIGRSTSEQVRNLAPHLLQHLEPEALREAIGSTAFRWMSEVRTADELLQSLARLSPAFGMIGTIMGLVDLFANMRDSASLGPGMAMALLATLYGLILCYCAYMPLAQRIRGYLAAGIGEQRVIERAIGLILDGRPVQEVRVALLDAAQGGSLSSAPTTRPQGSGSAPGPQTEISPR